MSLEPTTWENLEELTTTGGGSELTADQLRAMLPAQRQAVRAYYEDISRTAPAGAHTLNYPDLAAVAAEDGAKHPYVVSLMASEVAPLLGTPSQNVDTVNSILDNAAENDVVVLNAAALADNVVTVTKPLALVGQNTVVDRGALYTGQLMSVNSSAATGSGNYHFFNLKLMGNNRTTTQTLLGATIDVDGDVYMTNCRAEGNTGSYNMLIQARNAYVNNCIFSNPGFFDGGTGNQADDKKGQNLRLNVLRAVVSNMVNEINVDHGSGPSGGEYRFLGSDYNTRYLTLQLTAAPTATWGVGDTLTATGTDPGGGGPVVMTITNVSSSTVYEVNMTTGFPTYLAPGDTINGPTASTGTFSRIDCWTDITFSNCDFNSLLQTRWCVGNFDHDTRAGGRDLMSLRAVTYQNCRVNMPNNDINSPVNTIWKFDRVQKVLFDDYQEYIPNMGKAEADIEARIRQSVNPVNCGFFVCNNSKFDGGIYSQSDNNPVLMRVTNTIFGTRDHRLRAKFCRTQHRFAGTQRFQNCTWHITRYGSWTNAVTGDNQRFIWDDCTCTFDTGAGVGGSFTYNCDTPFRHQVRGDLRLINEGAGFVVTTQETANNDRANFANFNMLDTSGATTVWDWKMLSEIEHSKGDDIVARARVDTATTLAPPTNTTIGDRATLLVDGAAAASLTFDGAYNWLGQLTGPTLVNDEEHIFDVVIDEANKVFVSQRGVGASDPAPSGPYLTNLIGWWEITGADTSQVADSHSNGLHIPILNGPPTTTAGRFGTTISWGQNTIVGQIFSDTLKLAGPVTFGAWVSHTPDSNNRGIGGRDRNGNRAWSMSVSANRLNAQYSTSSGSGVDETIADTVDFPTSGQTFVTMVYDHANTRFALYKDGTEVATGTTGGALYTGSNGEFLLGTIYNLSGINEWQGTIERMFVYDRALSEAEIQTIFSNEPSYDDLADLGTGGSGGAFTALSTSEIIPTDPIVLQEATGHQVALTVNYDVNKVTSGDDTGLLLKMTDTASPGTSLVIDAQVGGTSVFSVDEAGNIVPAEGNQYGTNGRNYNFEGNTLNFKRNGTTKFRMTTNGFLTDAVTGMTTDGTLTIKATGALSPGIVLDPLDGIVDAQGVLVAQSQRAMYRDFASATETLLDTDSGKVLRFVNVGGDCTATVPATAPKGWYTTIIHEASDNLTIAVGGNGSLTTYPPGLTDSAGQGAFITLYCADNADNNTPIVYMSGGIA